MSQYVCEENDYMFEENKDFTSVLTSTVVNNGATRELDDYALTIDMAKEISMITKNEQGKIARRYFIEVEKKYKEQQLTLSRKHELALMLYDGGSSSIVAHKELLEIETIELKEKHELELRLQKDGNNKILSGVGEVVNMLKIKGLTTTIFTEWMVSRGLGEYVKFEGDKKRTFQPTELFFEYVSKLGYGLTGTTEKGTKTKVIYTIEFVNRILNNHMQSLIDFVEVQKLC